MKFYFHPDAKEELDGAVAYDESGPILPVLPNQVFLLISYILSNLALTNTNALIELPLRKK
jgi:hypothetical protein